MIVSQRITIVQIRRPIKKDINEELQWFCDSLGVSGLRDKDRSCYRIFIELVKASKRQRPMSSDELGYKLNLTRGTVVHHLNKLIDGGLVVSDQSKYMLRVNNLSILIDEIEKDMRRICDDLKSVAKDIDENLGL
jgi:predicted transcriptional regulator